MSFGTNILYLSASEMNKPRRGIAAMSLRTILLIVITAITITARAGVLPVIANPARADNQCIRAGSQEIILYDLAQEYCPMEFTPADPPMHWKIASDNGQPSCWRDDESFVYVATNSGVPNIYSRATVEDISACKKFVEHATDQLWESEIEKCENSELPEQVAELSCYGALVLAERYYGDSDPRLLIAIDHLSVRTDDMAEAEELLKRATDIRQKHFPSDYVGQIGTLSGIGALRKRQHDIDGAETAYLEAIRLGRQHLGEDALDVIGMTLLLGKVYFDLGMFPKAEEKLLAALASAERHRVIYLATVHRIAAHSARLLADIYQKQSKSVEADRYREIARKHREAASQPGSPEIDIPSGNADLS
jgi:tetratricopeptide (TPR) repeat protein